MRTRNLSLDPIIPNATPVAFRATRAFFFGHVTTRRGRREDGRQARRTRRSFRPLRFGAPFGLCSERSASFSQGALRILYQKSAKARYGEMTVDAIAPRFSACQRIQSTSIPSAIKLSSNACLSPLAR
jgi:hypothetical protein